MDWEGVWSILKWVILVFLAGFIGYFGRHLSQTLITRMRKRKEREEAGDQSTPDEAELIRQKQRAKIEKKRLKAEIKREKKKNKDKRS
jgi:hypothetical protein